MRTEKQKLARKLRKIANDIDENCMYFAGLVSASDFLHKSGNTYLDSLFSRTKALRNTAEALLEPPPPHHASESGREIETGDEVSGKPRLLDLFCKAGGCTRGYQLAGFWVRGVDIEAQPRYVGEEFVQDDAIAYLRALIDSGEIAEFDAIHASPPCQEYSTLKSLKTRMFEKLIPQTREALIASGKPYVMENVAGAKKDMLNPLMLCGTMFDLRVIRHRLFETNPPIYFPPFTCRHWGKTPPRNDKRIGSKSTSLARYSFLTITGHDFSNKDGSIAMGIDWMNNSELAEAIPPAYTEFIGKRLLEHLKQSA